MHKQYSCLVQVKASKRLGSDQLESDNSHEHALKLINTECKHEQDIIRHEHKYRGGYVDFVSTTCVNMCQVESLNAFKGGYHPIIPYHNHSNSMLARKVNHYNSQLIKHGTSNYDL